MNRVKWLVAGILSVALAAVFTAPAAACHHDRQKQGFHGPSFMEGAKAVAENQEDGATLKITHLDSQKVEALKRHAQFIGQRKAKMQAGGEGPCGCGMKCGCGCADGEACTCGKMEGKTDCGCGEGCGCGCADGAPCSCGNGEGACGCGGGCGMGGMGGMGGCKHGKGGPMGMLIMAPDVDAQFVELKDGIQVTLTAKEPLRVKDIQAQLALMADRINTPPQPPAAPALPEGVKKIEKKR